MRAFHRRGVLAIEPQAFFGLFDEAPSPENEEVAQATIVPIRGPLVHHAGGWCDSYDDIRRRVVDACAGAAPAVVLRIDSPGGEASGCLDTSRELRRLVESAGKRLVAYVDGAACSAAYALACAADRIVASPTAAVGSIGMIAARVDATGMDAQLGLKWSLITSGARKVDGNEHVAMSEVELEGLQQTVDMMASQFFELVAESRGLSAEAVGALEAGVFRGSAMVERGLVDELASFDSMLATVAGGPAARAADEVRMDKDEEARQALQAIIDDEQSDEKAKARARAALAALDESDEDDTAAEGDGEGDSEDEEEAPAARAASAAMVDADAVRAIVVAELSARDEQVERAQLIASRPDLDPATVALLETAPIARVRSYVESTPRRAYQPASAGSVRPTLGEGQGGAVSRLAPEAKAELDARMGLVPTRTAVLDDGRRQLFGVPTKAPGTGAPAKV